MKSPLVKQHIHTQGDVWQESESSSVGWAESSGRVLLSQSGWLLSESDAGCSTVKTVEEVLFVSL